MAKSSVRVWFARDLETLRVEKRATMKGICAVMGVRYNTFRRDPELATGKALVYVPSHGGAASCWRVWVEEIER